MRPIPYSSSDFCIFDIGKIFHLIPIIYLYTAIQFILGQVVSLSAIYVFPSLSYNRQPLFKTCRYHGSPNSDGWGCADSCGGHHRLRGKTTTGSALDGAVFDIAQILTHLIHNMSWSQLYLGFVHFDWLASFFGQYHFGRLMVKCISSVELTLFRLADILLQHRVLFMF